MNRSISRTRLENKTYQHHDIFNTSSKSQSNKTINNLSNDRYQPGLKDHAIYQYNPVHKKQSNININHVLTPKQLKLLQFYGTIDSNNQSRKPNKTGRNNQTSRTQQTEQSDNHSNTVHNSGQKTGQNRSSQDLSKSQHDCHHQQIDKTQQILKIIDDHDNLSSKIQKCQSIDDLKNTKQHQKKQKNQDSAYKSIQQLLKSQMFENEHTRKYQQKLKESGNPSKPVWNDDANVDKRHQDINYSDILGKESQARRNISNDSNHNNIRKSSFNKTSNQNFNPALRLNAFQKKQRDNNSAMDNFQQRFLRCRISLEPKDESVSFKNNSRTKKESNQDRRCQ